MVVKSCKDFDDIIEKNERSMYRVEGGMVGSGAGVFGD